MSDLPKSSRSQSPIDGIVVLFSAAVFLSAFLLFQVQPLIGKAILPWFGGTPGVWTTCMLFFQMLLCGGYLYSHMLTGKIPTHRQGQVHVTLLIVSLLLLQILPDPSWKPTGAEPPVCEFWPCCFQPLGCRTSRCQQPGRCCSDGSAKRGRPHRPIDCMHCRTPDHCWHCCRIRLSSSPRCG